jgi:hypothetical protein
MFYLILQKLTVTWSESVWYTTKNIRVVSFSNNPNGFIDGLRFCFGKISLLYSAVVIPYESIIEICTHYPQIPSFCGWYSVRFHWCTWNKCTDSFSQSSFCALIATNINIRIQLLWYFRMCTLLLLVDILSHKLRDILFCHILFIFWSSLVNSHLYHCIYVSKTENYIFRLNKRSINYDVLIHSVLCIFELNIIVWLLFFEKQPFCCFMPLMFRFARSHYVIRKKIEATLKSQNFSCESARIGPTTL